MVLSASLLTAQHAVFESQDLGEGYKESAWFAQYNAEHYPWIYHEEHGWMFVAKADADQIYLWDARLGWMWTTPEAYPVLFNDLSGWVDYQGKENEHRKFWDLTTNEILTDQERPGGMDYFPIPGSLENYVWKYRVNDGQPIPYTEPDLDLTMAFQSMDVTFSGETMVKSTIMDANVQGKGIIDGQWYPLTGTARIGTFEHMGWNTLGIYQTQVDASFFIQIHVVGITFNTDTIATVSGLEEILAGFPWKGDLYELDIGTVYTQDSLSGWFDGESFFSIEGFPEYDEYDSFAQYMSSPIKVRFEIVAKYPVFEVRGRSYNRVVKVAVRMDEADPSTGAIVTQVEYNYYAPGIGLIMAEASDPGLDESFIVELVDCNLW